MRDSDAADMAQLDPCELLPEALAWVELRGIRRQALQMEAWCRPVRQELPAEMAAVAGCSIPDAHHPARHFTPQVLQQGDDILRMQGAVLAVEVQLALRRNRTDGGKMISGAPLPQEGCLAHGRIGADDARQGVESGFVDEEDGLPLGLRPLLMAGQVSSRHRAIAASSRWRARRAGFCGLHRRALHKRPTWRGGEEIPNANRMTAAMRP